MEFCFYCRAVVSRAFCKLYGEDTRNTKIMSPRDVLRVQFMRILSMREFYIHNYIYSMC
jgi:hypothetical protein